MTNMNSIYKKMLMEHGISDLYPFKGLDLQNAVYGYQENQQFKLCDETLKEIHFEEAGLSGAFAFVKREEQYVLLTSLEDLYYKRDDLNQELYVFCEGLLTNIYDCLLSPNKSIILFSQSPSINTKDIVTASAIDLKKKSLWDLDDFWKYSYDSECHNNSVSIIANGTMISNAGVIAILELDSSWNSLLIENRQGHSLIVFSESGEIIKSFPYETICFKCWTWGNECFSLFFRLKDSADFLYLSLPDGKNCKFPANSIITYKGVSFFYQDYLILDVSGTYEVINQAGERLCHGGIGGDSKIIKVENGIIVFEDKWYDEVVSYDELRYDKCHPHYEYTFFNLNGTWLGNTDEEIAVLRKTIQSPYNVQEECIDLEGVLRVSDCKLLVPFLFDHIQYVIYDDQDSVWSIVSQKSPLGQKRYGLFHNSELVIPLQECEVGDMRYPSLHKSSDYFYFFK